MKATANTQIKVIHDQFEYLNCPSSSLSSFFHFIIEYTESGVIQKMNNNAFKFNSAAIIEKHKQMFDITAIGIPLFLACIKSIIEVKPNSEPNNPMLLKIHHNHSGNTNH